MFRGTSAMLLLSPSFDLADRIRVNAERSVACNPSLCFALGIAQGNDGNGVRFASLMVTGKFRQIDSTEFRKTVPNFVSVWRQPSPTSHRT